MRDIKISQSKSKQRLLEAAEQLFADRGFESVSVRDVTQLAKANVAAINYHFGSRDGLIAMVVLRYVSPINEERMLRLEALEKKFTGKSVPIEEVLDAFVRPLVGVVRKSELSERLFCQLIGRIFAMRGEGLPADVMLQMQALSDRFIRLLGKALPGLVEEELVWRMHFMVGSMIHMLTHQEMLHVMSHGASGEPTMELTLSRFIRFAAAGLREGTEVEEKQAVKKSSPQGMFDF